MTLLQDRDGIGGQGGADATVHFLGTTTVGATILVVVWNYYSTSVLGFTLSVSDDKGNSYTKDFDKSDWGGSGGTLQVWRAPVTTAGDTTITVSQTAAGYTLVSAFEVSGDLRLDQVATAEPNSTSYSAGPATTTQADEFLIGTNHAYDGSSPAFIPSGGFSSAGNATDGFHATGTHYRIVSATGSYSESGSTRVSVLSSAILTYYAVAVTDTVEWFPRAAAAQGPRIRNVGY